MNLYCSFENSIQWGTLDRAATRFETLQNGMKDNEERDLRFSSTVELREGKHHSFLRTRRGFKHGNFELTAQENEMLINIASRLHCTSLSTYSRALKDLDKYLKKKMKLPLYHITSLGIVPCLMRALITRTSLNVKVFFYNYYYYYSFFYVI